MNKFTCSNPDCTVAVTGKCVLLHDPVESCENAIVRIAPAKTPLAQSGERHALATVYNGMEMGWQQISTLMAERYGHVIGVLGETNAGKTSLLSALYLLASCGDFRPNYVFAGSFTLPGFENRLRNLRKWSGRQLPVQIVDHTTASTERAAGLLHLAFQQRGRKEEIQDLFFTDLPGEVTTEAAMSAEKAKQLAFLKRADCIVIAISGPDLHSDALKNSKVQFTRMLLQRLRNPAGVDPETPVVFAITRCDISGRKVPKAIYQIINAAEQIGFTDVSFQLIASFSDQEGVPSGMGLSSLLVKLLEHPMQAVPYPEAPGEPGNRMIARFVAKGDLEP